MEVFTLQDRVKFNDDIYRVNELLPFLKSVDPASYEFILSKFTELVIAHNPNVVVTTCDVFPRSRSLPKKYKIKDVIFNEPATIVIWADGTKTIVKCQPGDEYNKETGLAMCIAKKYLGNKGNFNEVFKKYIEGYDPREKNK